MLEQWYWLIPNSVLFSKELTDKQKLLFCVISNLCAEKWFCWATNEYLWERLWVNKWTISKNITTLYELWFINIENWLQRKITLVENHKGGCEKSQGGVVKNHNHNNTIEYNNIIKENKKRKYLEFVYLTDTEYNKLIDSYGARVIDNEITNLNNYIWQNWKDKYKSHYHTILNRLRRAWIKELPKKQENESWIYDLPF